MENFSYHLPFYVVTGGVATQGHSSDLTPGKIGLFDRATWSVGTSIGNGKEYFFAHGNIGGKTWYGEPITESHKSPFFLAENVENIYVSRPARPVNEEWVIGYNGSPSSKSLKFTKGEATRIQFHFHGEPTYRFFNGPKDYVVSYTPELDCTTPCTAPECEEPISDCLVHTQSLIDKINNHVELRKFGVTAKLTVDPYTATTTNMVKYCMSICDNGEALDLSAVKAQYPGKDIVRTKRVGSQSTYEFCQPGTDSAPANFTQSGSVSLAVCGACPVGSTLTESRSVYIVNRPLAGTEDLNDDVARQTYADLVGTSYETATAVTFAGTVAGVNVGTDVITKTAHGFSTGNLVTYSNGGGTSITGLTSGSNYYVIRLTADTLKLASTAANAYAGTAIDLTVVGVGTAHLLTPVITATFVGNNGATASVKLKVGEGVQLPAQLSDISVFSSVEAASCAFSAPASIAWTSCGTGIRSQRTLRINNLNRPDCNATGDRIDDLRSVLAGVVGIQLNTLTKVAGTSCKDDYTVSQWSVDCLDESCLTNNVTFTYDSLPAFENESWNVVPPTVVENTSRKCGIKVTAGYIDPQFGNCSFNPLDYYNMEPIKMEISLLDELGERCDAAQWPTVSQTRVGVIGRQSGESVIREVIMKNDAYLKHVKQFDLEPRMREAFDMNLLNTVDRKAYYDIYYVTYKSSYGNSHRKREVQEMFTTVFAFKEGDSSSALFESQILDVLTAKSGVALHVNK